ncbi:2-methylisocitrate dehydratase, Fe/S-dependent, partial [Vibrio parahaemolyticus VP2007-007]
NNH